MRGGRVENSERRCRLDDSFCVVQFLLTTPYFGPVETPPASVPEPGTLGLLLAGALAASNGRKRVVRNMK
jgi:hypothetical protein